MKIRDLRMLARAVLRTIHAVAAGLARRSAVALTAMHDFEARFTEFRNLAPAFSVGGSRVPSAPGGVMALKALGWAPKRKRRNSSGTYFTSSLFVRLLVSCLRSET